MKEIHSSGQTDPNPQSQVLPQRKTMETLDGFRIELSLEETLRKLRIDAGRADKLGARELFEAAVSLIHPRSAYASASVTHRARDAVIIEGAEFRSRILTRNLEGVETVFPYVMTIGEALEREARTSENVVSQLLLEELGNSALGSSVDYLQCCISQKHGLETVSHMSPGQLDWSIDQQRQLFSILGNVEETIGVRLTDSLLMIPRKSVSGIMFPTELPFISCQLCQRQGCSSRRAPYDEAVSQKYSLDRPQQRSMNS